MAHTIFYNGTKREENEIDERRHNFYSDKPLVKTVFDVKITITRDFYCKYGNCV